MIYLLVSDFQRSVWSVPSISVAVLALYRANDAAVNIAVGRNNKLPRPLLRVKGQLEEQLRTYLMTMIIWPFQKRIYLLPYEIIWAQIANTYHVIWYLQKSSSSHVLCMMKRKYLFTKLLISDIGSFQRASKITTVLHIFDRLIFHYFL